MLELPGVIQGKTILCSTLLLWRPSCRLLHFAAEDSSPNTKPLGTRRPVKITISKDTTYLTGPIRSRRLAGLCSRDQRAMQGAA